MKKGFTGQQWNINSKSHKGSEENSEPEGAQLGPVLESTNNLVGTEGKQISLVSEDIPERVEVNTYSKDSSGNLTKSIEIQVDMDYLKPKSQDASVQCELIGGPMGWISQHLWKTLIVISNHIKDYINKKTTGQISWVIACCLSP